MKLPWNEVIAAQDNSQVFSISSLVNEQIMYQNNLIMISSLERHYEPTIGTYSYGERYQELLNNFSKLLSTE